MKHKVGDILWAASSHGIAMIVEYLPNGIHGSEKFKYSVRNHYDTKAFYTDEMIEVGKQRLKEIHEQEPSNW